MKLRRLAVLMLSISASIAMPANAAGWKAVPPEVRDSKMPLPVAVHLAQSELRIGVDPSMGPTPNMYGLVGALMIGAMESGQSKKARAEVEPLVRALGDFDAGAPLMAGIQDGMSGISWLRVLTPSPLRDNSTEAKNTLFDKVPGDRLVDVDCSYNVGQSFEAIYGRCTIQIAEKQIGNASPDTRWKPGKLLLNRVVQTETALDLSASSTPLPHCFGSERREICRAKWAENSALLLRKQLVIALEKLGNLVGKAIGIHPPEVDIAKQPNLVILSFGHRGLAIEGIENVAEPGRMPGMWVGGKLAVLKPDSGGVTITDEEGSLYHRQVVAGR